MEKQQQENYLSEGDLGLGDGLKPGGLPVFKDETPESQDCQEPNTTPSSSVHSDCCSCSESDEELELSLLPIQSIRDLKNDYKPKKMHARCRETRPNENLTLPHISSAHNCHDDLSCTEDTDNSDFPIYADVPYGTSIRQQKKLFKHDIEELKKKCYQGYSSNHANTDSHSDIGGKAHRCKANHLTSEKIAKRLAGTLQEVDDLQTELETCELRLDSKYKAITILRKQAEEAQLQLKVSRKMSQEKTVKFAQEVNKLQFELQTTESATLNNQQIWAQHFDSFGGGGAVVSELVGADSDLGEGRQLTQTHRLAQQVPPAKPKKVPRAKYHRVCQENASLLRTLELRTEELRRISAKKMAVERENDELLALLDIQERTKYDKSRSVSSEENYCTFSSTELAVLGACRCRVSEPDPCGCAHAAANMKRQICQLREEINQYKNRRDEAFMTVDAYRKAFEEQLQRNKVLTTKLSQLLSNSHTKVSRARTAFKWFIGTLSDEEISDDESSQSRVNGSAAMSDQEIITYLTELLHEKKEVLAHQKLAAQVLGDRVKLLEGKLTLYEKDEVFS